MTGRFSRVLLAGALLAPGLLASRVAAQDTPAAPRKLEFMAGFGLGFGSSGIHQSSGVYDGTLRPVDQDSRGDSKPGEYLVARLGLARMTRPFLVLDVEWQPFDAPAPPVTDVVLTGTPPREQKVSVPVGGFSAFSVLAGVALYPVADFYLMPRLGVQFRDWTYPGEDFGFSESGLSTGVDAGYHLPFGEAFSLSPEVFFRYSVVEGPDSPSHRGFGLKLMAHWRF